MKIKRSKMKSVAICDDTGKIRYALTRTWDEKKDRAVVIGVSPNTSDEIRYDQMTGNLLNLLIDREYGAFSVLNLYPVVNANQQHLYQVSRPYLERNNELIDKFCDYTNTIIVAWGEDENRYRRQRQSVIQILKKYEEKVMIFKTRSGGVAQLRYNGCDVELVPYFGSEN